MTSTSPTNDALVGSSRWRLNRAGIVNVYQYGDETIHFGGGRLLLRGVNGSGKSTAMNMLLPFLLTARVRGIDAAGEQTGVLKAWMLSGRDEAQPIGYLWVEFERGVLEPDGHRCRDAADSDSVAEHVVIGCGIKANRSTDNISTWWFVTTKRPGHDVTLVDGGVPLSADALRVALDPDPVFAHDRRADYRREVQRRLYGGADLDQFLTLLNTVRNPRVGDRVDVDLPEHLVGALPALSEHALIEAARPLDDLDEHRRNVADLEATSTGLAAIADVYGNYARSEIQRACADAHVVLSSADSARRRERRVQQATTDAGAAESAAAAAAEALRGDIERLAEEIAALEKSSAYTEGIALDDLRSHVQHLRATVGERRQQATLLHERVPALEQSIRNATSRTDGDHAILAAGLARIDTAATVATLTVRTPTPPAISRRPLEGPSLDVSRPERPIDIAAVTGRLDAVAGASRLRTADLHTVRAKIAAVESEETELRAAELLFDAAQGRVAQATALFDAARRALIETGTEWDDVVRHWVADAAPHFVSLNVPAPAVFANAGDESTSRADRHARRTDLVADAAALVERAQRIVIDAEHVVAARQLAADEAQHLVDELAARDEPEPPALPWQTRSGPCLADLVDFAPDLDDTARAGLEGALDASGMLAATVGHVGLTLADGQLIARSTTPCDHPLGAVLQALDDDDTGVDGAQALVEQLLACVSTDVAGNAPTAVAVTGHFRIGVLAGRHAKHRAEHVGVSARRAALERRRSEAADALAAASSELHEATVLLHDASGVSTAVVDVREALPTLTAVDEAAALARVAEERLGDVRGEVVQLSSLVTDADRRLTTASDDLARTANSLHLPTDRSALDDLDRALSDIANDCRAAQASAQSVGRSCDDWIAAVGRWETNAADLAAAVVLLAQAERDHDARATRLATLEDTLGAEYREVVATIETSQNELDEARRLLPPAQQTHTVAIRAHANAVAAAATAGAERESAELGCTRAHDDLIEVLDVPGLIAVATQRTTTTIIDDGAIPTTTGDATGLRELLTAIERRFAPPTNEGTTADGVRFSLRARRDSLGAGWDAEDRQPDPGVPMSVSVDGPLGRMHLADAVERVAAQHAQLTSLLTQKQDQALRSLLQGLVAREVAEKMFTASTLVELMNDRLATVSTAHGIGVRLRWRRSPELDDDTRRTVDILAKLPDLRTEAEEADLRDALSSRLDDARRLDPDAPYRQLIAQVFDYRRWHEMDVLLRRGSEPERPLGRRTPLSEGEKKLVTYLPLFAAVAASCDALGDVSRNGRGPTVPRFLLLDDAFAKVSEDNHAQLFGLLVDLDLDFIATSERLWGTHATVPELAITEVVRDAELGVIMLEHARWNSAALTAGTSP